MNIDMSISTSPLQVSFNGPVIVSKDYVLKARIQGVDNNLINKNLEIHNRTWNTDFKMLNLISNCSFDNEIISVTFKNEAELYETDISFEGVLYSDYSEYEYSRLSHKGTGIYYTAVNPQEKAQVKEERADYKIFPLQTKGHYSFIEDVSGMRISMPSLISYDTRGSDYAEEDCLMFQDLRGESYALSIVYDRTSNPMVFYRSALPSGVSYSKYKAKFVNEDDMMQCIVLQKIQHRNKLYGSKIYI